MGEPNNQGESPCRSSLPSFPIECKMEMNTVFIWISSYFRSSSFRLLVYIFCLLSFFFQCRDLGPKSVLLCTWHYSFSSHFILRWPFTLPAWEREMSGRNVFRIWWLEQWETWMQMAVLCYSCECGFCFHSGCGYVIFISEVKRRYCSIRWNKKCYVGLQREETTQSDACKFICEWD